MVFKTHQLSAQGQLTFINLKWLSVLETSFRKTAPKEIHCRDYKKFNADNFEAEFKQNLATSSRNYENFEKAFLTLLDKHAPYKIKKIRANQVPYMTKKTLEKQS